MKLNHIDNGKNFDFGNTSKEYAKYRDIYPRELYEKLYSLGLRNILLVWNNPNKYGSGNMGDYGLTEAGVEFLKKAIDLGITIDLSHMNDNTFWDTIKLLKEQN